MINYFIVISKESLNQTINNGLVLNLELAFTDKGIFIKKKGNPPPTRAFFLFNFNILLTARQTHCKEPKKKNANTL
jgi:hypothetical protein